MGFALIADALTRATGATRGHGGELVVAKRANARRNPLLRLRGGMTVAGYPASGPFALCAGR